MNGIGSTRRGECVLGKEKKECIISAMLFMRGNI
jgi:hypothetical protein